MKHKISIEKEAELKSELHYLETTKRDQLNEGWRLAVQEGDDRETDALSVAVKLLQELEIRVHELKKILSNYEIITPSTRSKRIKLGSKVIIELNGIEQEITLVDPIEANPSQGKISIESPLGTALNGKKPTDTTTLSTPRQKNLLVKVIKLA